MSTASRPYPIVQDLIESFANWLKHRREMSEMRQLDRADFDRIANDLRIAPDDLEELVRHGKHAADELPKMLEQLGINGSAAHSRCCCATWSGSVRSVVTRASATATSPTAPPRRTITVTAPTLRRWNRSIARTLRRADVRQRSFRLGVN
jgi:uncharacterized protein YjiS (DUF1127 family)